jgi:sugar/nucleoside kinase (ribokinase family)
VVRYADSQVVNPIGAGDTCAGMMAYCMRWGMPPADAFHWGLSAASASCLQEGGAVYRIQDAHDLHDQFKLESSEWHCRNT